MTRRVFPSTRRTLWGAAVLLASAIDGALGGALWRARRRPAEYPPVPIAGNPETPAVLLLDARTARRPSTPAVVNPDIPASRTPDTPTGVRPGAPARGAATSLIRSRARRALWGAGVLLASAVVGLVLSATLGAATGSHEPSSPTFAAPVAKHAGRFDLRAVLSLATLPRGASITAQVRAHRVRVYAQPSEHTPSHELRTLYAGGRALPLILLVERRRPGWLKVQLPVRPNLSTGWIHSAHVSLRIDLYRVSVALAAHQLTVWRGTRVIDHQPIGVGVSLSPTPSGRYYITDLIRPPDPTGLYGPYAFGLSAYSAVYTTFAGGDGQVGLHGTDDPAGIGHDVSHGCIRLNNQSITRLAHLLPIGTPVLIRH